MTWLVEFMAIIGMVGNRNLPRLVCNFLGKKFMFDNLSEKVKQIPKSYDTLEKTITFNFRMNAKIYQHGKTINTKKNCKNL